MAPCSVCVLPRCSDSRSLHVSPYSVYSVDTSREKIPCLVSSLNLSSLNLMPVQFLLPNPFGLSQALWAEFPGKDYGTTSTIHEQEKRKQTER